MAQRSWVSVVDDDESMRESLPDLLGELGFASRAFASAGEFLESDALEQTRCLILDVAMPGMSGPELQRELLRQGRNIPIIFITAQGDDKVRSAVLEDGAVAYLLKPFTEAELRAALTAALGTN
ncbi:MAG TPA: response regulator [Steroidobacteraceae bacterium]